MSKKESVDNLPPLFEKIRPDWEIKFSDVNNHVLSVMPGESDKSFYDPIIQRDVKWEQDVYSSTGVVYKDKIYAIYRAYGEDKQWRLGLAWSDDGMRFHRGEKPVLYARPEDVFLESLRELKDAGVSYGDSHLIAGPDDTFYLFFNYFSHFKVKCQELAVATSKDMISWTLHGRAFGGQTGKDRELIPENAPWRLPPPAIITRFQNNQLVAARINGKYWMYLNCYSTKGPCCLYTAISDNLFDWEIVRDAQGRLINPLPLRAGYFDSEYIDTTAAVLRGDGILLIYNGVNAAPEHGGDPRRLPTAHYPGQALFDRNDPAKLLKRSVSPFKGGDAELEKQPIVFWGTPLYESWSLVPFKERLLLYWNHGFGRRSIGLWTSPMPDNVRNPTAVEL